MSDQERFELEHLKAQQARLEKELQQLSLQLNRLELRLKQPALDTLRTLPHSAAPGLGTTPVPQPPTSAPPSAAVPPPIRAVPPVIPTKAVPVAAPVQRPESPVKPAAPVSAPPSLEPARTTTFRSPALPESTTPQPAPPAPERSLEMRLGTYWLVRIGIVMLLTGLVFFGNYAYQNFIGKLGPAGKVSLLYVASAMLLGAGAWWQRKAAKPALKNYAQVLFSGGLAVVYFTTFAAHHIEHLRIIHSAVLDGALLLAWAGFMVWMADRKKSELLALFAVGLAYYSSIITRVGSFTLYSNVVLTAAAVFFLVRNRWAALSFGSLVATYAAYGFWRFFDGSSWHWASPEQGLWTGTYFLICYWLLFTAAVFLSRHERLAGENRAAFLTLNNGAFFSLFLLTMVQVRQGGFWKFALFYGSALLILAELARRLLATEPQAKNSYLTQGLLLVTTGIISHPRLAGLHLALVLAMESVLLLLMGHQRKNGILLAGAYLVAGLAVGWGIDGMRQVDQPGLWLAVGLGALMLVNTVIVHRKAPPSELTLLRPQVSYFTLLALASWLVATWNNSARDLFPLLLAAEALLLTFSVYLLRVREISLLSQGYLVLAQLAWLANLLEPGRPLPWWNPALLLAITLGLSHWWQHQKVLSLRSRIDLFWQGLYALAVVGVFYFWLASKVTAPVWLALSSLLAVGLTLYGVTTRAWWVAAFGQIFLLVSGVQFVWQLSEARPPWLFPLAPLAALGLLSLGTVQWFQRRPAAADNIRAPLLQLAMVYRWIALGMAIWWICEYIPPRERIWLLALLGLWFFLWAGWKRSAEALLCSSVFTGAALILFWLPLIGMPTVYAPNLLVILLLLAQRQFARRLPERYPLSPGLHGAVILIGGLSLWLFLSRWVLEQASGFYLTASWSLLALAFFGAGIALRERMYRWMGLGVLACALGRVVVFDVWKLDTLYRILSFMALGIVLLVLGFIYNKYQEKIREWL